MPVDAIDACNVKNYCEAASGRRVVVERDWVGMALSVNAEQLNRADLLVCSCPDTSGVLKQQSGSYL